MYKIHTPHKQIGGNISPESWGVHPYPKKQGDA